MIIQMVHRYRGYCPDKLRHTEGQTDRQSDSSMPSHIYMGEGDIKKKGGGGDQQKFPTIFCERRFATRTPVRNIKNSPMQ